MIVFQHEIKVEIGCNNEGTPEYAVLRNAGDLPKLSQHNVINSALAAHAGGYHLIKVYLDPFPVEQVRGEYVKYRLWPTAKRADAEETTYEQAPLRSRKGTI